MRESVIISKQNKNLEGKTWAVVDRLKYIKLLNVKKQNHKYECYK
jgi:hypothetical protein